MDLPLVVGHGRVCRTYNINGPEIDLNDFLTGDRDALWTTRIPLG